MISCHGLRKTYGAVRAVDDVSFDVPLGQVTGLLGPNGSGKTTILKGILGLTDVEGRIVVDPSAAGSGARRAVGAALDITGFRKEMRIRDVITATAIRLGEEVDADAALDRVGLPDPRQRVGTLSLGMVQRLRIAVALVVPPAALILDEPLNGLDPQGIRWVRSLLADHVERGGAVLFSSHLLNEAEKIVDRVVVLQHGALVAEGPLASFARPGTSLEDAFFSTTTHPGKA